MRPVFSAAVLHRQAAFARHLENAAAAVHFQHIAVQIQRDKNIFLDDQRTVDVDIRPQRDRAALPDGSRQRVRIRDLCQPEHQMQRGVLLDVVVRQRFVLLQLLTRKDEPLLGGRDALLLLDLGLHAEHSFIRRDIQRDGLSGQRLDGDLICLLRALQQRDLRVRAVGIRPLSAAAGRAGRLLRALRLLRRALCRQHLHRQQTQRHAQCHQRRNDPFPHA